MSSRPGPLPLSGSHTGRSNLPSGTVTDSLRVDMANSPRLRRLFGIDLPPPDRAMAPIPTNRAFRTAYRPVSSRGVGLEEPGGRGAQCVEVDLGVGQHLQREVVLAGGAQQPEEQVAAADAAILARDGGTQGQLDGLS